MRMFRLVFISLIILSFFPPAWAATQDLNKWGNLMDVAYKFTWYPQKDLQDLLKSKSQEYGMTLEEYCGALLDDLTENASKTGPITPNSFIHGKDWKSYFRLSVAEFCLYLMNAKEVYLENAKSALSILSGKMVLSKVAYWHHFFQAHSSMLKKDREGFISSVFQVWENVVLKLEADDMLMMGSRMAKTELVRDLPFFYENLAHLIITEAIFDHTMADLYPLGVIVMSLNDKLTNENGYKNIVASVVERMHGLKSDCSNLNFAVAFVEATANQYEFEEEKSSSLLVPKYNLAREYYELALSWSHTAKGKSAIMTQYMGFHSYIIRRLIDENDVLTKNSFFSSLPKENENLVKTAMELFDHLARSGSHQQNLESNGFNEEKNYYAAMHQIWDSLSKLLMIQAAYYRSKKETNVMENLHIAKGPLLQYLSFFEKYAAKDSEIVPDNAFFLVAYAEKQLAELYRQASSFSTEIEINDLAFEYQSKATGMFPLDITGILHLAHQANQEGRLNMYMQKTGPVSARFRNSDVPGLWAEKVKAENKKYIDVTGEVIPDLIDRACFLVKILQESGSVSSEEELSHKAIIMTKLLVTLNSNHSDEIIEQALYKLAKADIKGSALDAVFQACLPENLLAEANAISGIETQYEFLGLKNALYSAQEHEIHSFLRALFYENNGT